MDRLCLNAQCSLITATWPTPHFYYFFDHKIFVSVDEKAGIFAKHILATLFWPKLDSSQVKNASNQGNGRIIKPFALLHLCKVRPVKSGWDSHLLFESCWFAPSEFLQSIYGGMLRMRLRARLRLKLFPSRTRGFEILHRLHQFRKFSYRCVSGHPLRSLRA